MMVSNVLDYSKMQEGLLEMQYKDENVNELVRDAVDLHL
jgi:K+-sensing histidine kinase KdpD